MAKIAVDIDDTLYSFTDEAREVLSLMVDEPEYAPYKEQLTHALYAKWDQWRTPFELCGSNAEGESLWVAHCIKRCHDDEAILRQMPFNGSVEICNELLAEGHELVYISNRATETQEATYDWLDDNGFIARNDDGSLRLNEEGDPVTTLVVTNGDKRPFIKDCQYQIDDRVKNVLEFIYDYDYESKVRRNAEAMRSYGPGTEDPEWVAYEAIVCELVDLAGVPEAREHRAELLDRMHEITDAVVNRYLAESRRKAFVRVADYNGGLTDVPGLYLAHTWNGLRRYMVKAGLLSKRSLVAA